MLQSPSSIKHFSSVCSILGQSYEEAFQGACFKIYISRGVKQFWILFCAVSHDVKYCPGGWSRATTTSPRSINHAHMSDPHVSGSTSQHFFHKFCQAGLCFACSGFAGIAVLSFRLPFTRFPRVFWSFFSSSLLKHGRVQQSHTLDLTRLLKPKGVTGESHARILFAHQDCSFAAYQLCPNSPCDHILQNTSCRRFDAVKVNAWGWRACRKYPRNVAQRLLRSCSSLVWYVSITGQKQLLRTISSLIWWHNLNESDFGALLSHTFASCNAGWSMQESLISLILIAGEHFSRQNSLAPGLWDCGSWYANLEPIFHKCIADRSSEEWRHLCSDRV